MFNELSQIKKMKCTSELRMNHCIDWNSNGLLLINTTTKTTKKKKNSKK